MTWFQALVLGVVEGVTEYLPVSSTGHLILAAWLMGLHETPADKEAAFTFTIVIQAGAIAAVMGLYRRRLAQMGRGLAGRDAPGRRLAALLALAFLPAAASGPFLAAPIRDHLNGPWPVVGALFVGGWLMLAVAHARRLEGQGPEGRSIESMDYATALLIGIGQCVAMWPGTSRSMMTIVTALLLGMSAAAAAEFSFLLGLVTLGAATAYEAYRGGPALLEAFGIMPLVIGFVASTVSAAFAVRWLVGFLEQHGVGPFGWYRLAIAAVLAVAVVVGG